MTTTATLPTVETVKAYWRCPSCLTVYVTAVPTPPRAHGPWPTMPTLPSHKWHLAAFTPTCAHCAVATEPMGVVTPGGKGGVTLTATTTVCDWSCQMALGPFCDCKCLGANHGDTLARKVIVLESRGTAPVVTVEEPEKALARAAEFKAAVVAAEAGVRARFAGIEAILEAKAAGRWVDNAAFTTLVHYWRAIKALEEAKHGKVHSNRMKKLAALAGGTEATP